MKRGLITGASRGIGRHIAVALAGEQFHLILQGRDRAALELSRDHVLKAGGTASTVIAELSDRSDLNRLVEAAGPEPLDLLVNNAGVATVKPLAEITLEEWQKSLAVNVTAPFYLIQMLSPGMRPGSAIVNILSVAAKSGFAGWSAYCTGKFALEGLSQSLREELREQKVRVINIYPGATDTELWHKVPGQWPKDRMMSPADIASALRYALLSPGDVAVESIGLGHISGKI